jgi:hypothetical protein
MKNNISDIVIQELLPHLVHSDAPVTARQLSDTIKEHIGTDHDINILGYALTKTDIRQKYLYKASPSGFPRKYKAYYVAFIKDQGNIKLSSKRKERAMEKAKKTIAYKKNQATRLKENNIRTSNLRKIYSKYI